MKQIKTAIDIAAPPATVWRILTDLDKYSLWNPFVNEAHGTVEVGSRLRVRLQPPTKRATTFRPTVTATEPEKTFEWLGRLGLPGIFDGRHRFTIEPTRTGTRVLQSEEFRGLLVPPLFRILEKSTTNGFDTMNQALKARAEAAYSGEA